MELKAALNESEKTVLALARELAAQDTIASAEKPFNAEETTRDAVSSTDSLSPSMEQLNAASGIKGTATANVHSSPAKLNTAGGGWFTCGECLQNTDEAAAPPMTAMKPRRLRGGGVQAER
jgi:hypothetical protein